MSRDRSTGLTDEGTKLTIRIRPVISFDIASRLILTPHVWAAPYKRTN
jgi:hypothetical protein